MRVKLKDAFNLQMGKTPSRADLSLWGGNNKWISIADIGSAKKHISSTKECITDEGVSRSGIKVVPEGTVIMSFKLSIGKTAIVSEDMYTNEAIMAFIDNGTYCIDPNYLYHLCCGTDWTQGGNKAVMGLTLNKATLSEMEIELPTIEEQREIASILDQLDAIIEKRHDELNMIEQLVKSRFIELFGDLMENPHGWPIKKISDISLLLKSGLSRKLLSEDIGLPMIRSCNIQNGQFVYDDIKYWYVDDPQGAKTSDYVLDDGDILINFINSMSQIGKTAIFHDVGRECIYTTNIFRMKLAPNCNRYFYNWFAMTEYYYRQLQNIIQPAVNQASFTTVNFLNLSIPVPPLEIQEQFAAFVEQTDKSKYFACQTLSFLLKLANNLQSWREKQYDY